MQKTLQALSENNLLVIKYFVNRKINYFSYTDLFSIAEQALEKNNFEAFAFMVLQFNDQTDCTPLFKKAWDKNNRVASNYLIEACPQRINFNDLLKKGLSNEYCFNLIAYLVKIKKNNKLKRDFSSLAKTALNLGYPSVFKLS